MASISAMSSPSLAGARLVARPSSGHRWTVAAARPAVVVRASADDRDAARPGQLMLAGLMAGLFATSPLLMPDEAFAARSSGRVGGSSFRSSAPRSAPRSSSGAASSSSSRSGGVTIYNAPPLIGGYGGFGYGGGYGYNSLILPGFGYGFGFGGIIQFMVLSAIIGAVFNAVSSIGKGRKDDDEDTL